MSNIEDIEAAIRRLSPSERATLRAKLADLDAAEWDEQLENDVAAGRLDWLADEARDDLKSGRATDR